MASPIQKRFASAIFLARKVEHFAFVATFIPVVFLPLLVASDAVARKLLGFVIPGTIDITQYAIVIMTFMAGPWILRLDGHTRVDALLTICPPRVRLPLQVIGFVVGAVISAIMAWQGFFLVVTSFREEVLLNGYFAVPAYWIYLAIPLGALFYTIEFCHLVGESTKATLEAYGRSFSPLNERR